MEGKKLYRSKTDKMVAGVCGGLAEFLGIDSTMVRLVFAALMLFGVGSPLLIYVLLAVVIPLEP